MVLWARERCRGHMHVVRELLDAGVDRDKVPQCHLFGVIGRTLDTKKSI